MARREVEIAVIGGGVAGSVLAATLARRGHDVALIEPRAHAAPEFRAEKLTGGQVAALRRLGLARTALAVATPIERLRIARFGRLVDDRPDDEWGFDYASLVAALRGAVPREALCLARADAIEADATGARVTLSSGETVGARLAVVATGLGRSLLAPLGIGRIDVARDHSLAIGFDLVPAAGAPAAVPVTFFGERADDAAAYLTLFPIGDRLRANLFTYHHRDDPWVDRLRGAPLAALAMLMPGLAPLLPPIVAASTPVIRPIHLHACSGHVRPGVALIGDVFATTCPTGGTGLAKALNDAERLAALVPGWLATPGLDETKVAAFYADPAKRAGDAKARAMARHARAMAMNRGANWSLRRHAAFHAQRLRWRMRGSPAIDTPAGDGALIRGA